MALVWHNKAVASDQMFHLRCIHMAHCGLLALLIACASGLPDKYWCCPPDSATGGRCITCYGWICSQQSGGCPAGGLYYYESLCGQHTKCNASARSRKYWQCPGDGKKCRPCMGEHGELPVEFGGCPESDIHSSESVCMTATMCNVSGTGVSETTTAGLLKTRWYCGSESKDDSCKPCGGSGQSRCPDDRILFPHKRACETTTKCDGSPIRSTETTTAGSLKTRWYCGSESRDDSCKPCGGSGQSRCPDDKTLFPHERTCETTTKCDGSPIHSTVKPQPSNPDTSWYCSAQSDNGKCTSCRGDRGLLPVDKGGCPNITYDLYPSKKSCERTTYSWCFLYKKDKAYKRVEDDQFCILGGCDNYCEAETENKWHFSGLNNTCEQCSFVTCCSNMYETLVHDTEKACKDYRVIAR